MIHYSAKNFHVICITHHVVHPENVLLQFIIEEHPSRIVIIIKAHLIMAASKDSHSSTTKTERELENAASSDPTVKSDQHSVGVHPAFYIAYRISLHDDSTKANINARAGYGSL